jgi:N-acyl-D-aspartate/D-glutamate deacylase
MRTIALTGGTVIDGTGAPPRRADVLLGGDAIADVGRFVPPADADIVDATGLVVAPGFIDIHSHSDFTLLTDPRAVSAIAQGVTTEIVGNCGYGCAPVIEPKLAAIAIYGALQGKSLPRARVADYFARLAAARPAVNVMALVPNGQLRLGHVGVRATPATRVELSQMQASLHAALDDGAAGYSTGLEYAQEAGAPAAEITALCRIAAAAGGLYATHTRNRDTGAVAAIDEAIATARAANVRLQVSHITPRTGMAATAEAIRLVEHARAAGLDVAFDMHTRTFGFTHLKNIVPPAMLEGTPAEVRARLDDAAQCAAIAAHPNLIRGVGDWDRVVLTGSRNAADVNGLSIAAIGERWNLAPLNAAVRVLALDAEHLLEPMVLLKTYDEDVLAATYRHPLCMIGSDATTLAPDGPLAGEIFHGAYTWAAWFWRRMVRELAVLDAPAAIHRLTGLPAATMRLADRGILRRGARADVVAFDPQAFGETGTVAEPNRLAVGMRHVFVNGVATLRDGARTDARAGRVLRRTG